MSAGSGTDTDLDLGLLDEAWAGIADKKYSFEIDERHEWLITPALRLANAYPKLRAEIERQRAAIDRLRSRSNS